MSQRSKFCIIGIPDHQGVHHVGGRLGAAYGPKAFRRVFGRFKGRNELERFIFDAKDVPGLGSDVAENHSLTIAYITKTHPLDGTSVVVGGGHDHGYTHLAGIHAALSRATGCGRSKNSKKLRLGCINIDAHLDVRKPVPTITSGSPFYLAIESQILEPQRLIEFGIQTHCNAPTGWDYIQKKKIPSVLWDQLRGGKAVKTFHQHLTALAKKSDAIVISLDLDAIACGFAPGVSAPQAEGFNPSEIIEMIEIAGNNKKVVSLGIFELNPEFDRDDQTARIAATCAYHFFDAAYKRTAKK